MKELKLGDTVWFVSGRDEEARVISDEVRGIFTIATEEGEKKYYSRVSNVHNFAIYLIREENAFSSKEEALKHITGLKYGEGTSRAE